MSIYVRDADGNRQLIAGVGLPGPPGKSAYQYAVEGGFTGTEDEFRALMGVRINSNLLDNWYFADPINQLGQTEYTDGYGIDRWHNAQCHSSLQTGGIKLKTNEGAPYASFYQVLPQAIGEDDNTVYTMSALIGGNLFTGTGKGYDLIAISSATNNFIRIFNGKHIEFVLFDDTPLIQAAKLELGPVQTLAHKDASGNWVLNDPPPNKALELAKCQRYQENVTNVHTGNVTLAGYIGVGGEYNRLLFDTPIPFKVTKRTVPIIKDVILAPISDDGSVTTEIHTIFDWAYCTEDALFHGAVSSQYVIEPGRKYYISFLADSNL